ncbi:MAG: putative Ig domain-containing protein [Nostoc sp. DedVER02]|uniref:putative Ig domain-containing protein n=1 Tax=unclassified Nostoc TaxID=2593658 RepID=UPI002AD47D3E|nr:MULTISPECIES: putative Ig domain-containing protein [unclassified Nostoc]MDZ7984639.1 Ig-like domain-containing protein [Nostoc sp. DedVER02]MDZ8111232.1 Ig-like domain-containing protein [Nostoc sp. DedVER01b]
MALTQGDIAFISFNADEDGWSIVTFVDIDPNTIIYFTDNEATSLTAFNTGESYFQWNSGVNTITAGTVIRFSAIDNATNLAASIGSFNRVSVSGSSNYGLSATNETIYAYLGSSADSPTVFLSGISNDTNAQGTTDLTTAGLTIGTNSILLNSSADYGVYNGARSGQSSFANYKLLVNNVSNWTVDTVNGDYANTVPNTTNFAIASGNPTVNLSVNTNSGTEAGTTQIIVTATASSVVSGDQTVNLGVTGTNITAGDYNLSNTVITILNGQTTGSVTFTIVDDALIEGTETARLTISNPSTGITLGSTTTQNITITDNDGVVGQAPTIQLNTASTTDLLDANGALSTIGAGAISGVIGNVNDPAKTLGVNFTIADSDTPVENLTVTVTSSNAAVVPNGNLTLTGTGSNRNLKINPVGVGTANITVTVSDGASSANYAIAYAASANDGTATTQFLTGTSDASTAIPVGGTFFLEADDENQVLRLYDYSKSGLPVTGFDFTSSLGLTQTDGSGVLREVDLEASTKVGNRIFWLGSQSNSDDGKNRPNRDRIFATDITGAGASTTLSYVGRYNFLKEDIINWDVTNGHGKGANYYGLAASAATDVGSKQSNGYNIEGLEIAPDNTTAYIAFRAPQVPLSGRANALIVQVTNFTNLISTSGGTQGLAQFGAPIELNLGGRGIREIRKNANNQYVIIAGPAGDAGAAPNDFRLYTWDGNPNSQPQLRAATFPANFNPEGIITIPDNLTNTSQIQFVSDDGNSILYNDGTSAKDLSENNFKKFRTDSITLGTVVLTPRIHDIQGASHISPLNGQQVGDVGGIVTVIKSNGFYLQDPNPDNDDRTSEAIFVFTSSAPTVSVGDSVLVNGTVTEFRPANNANNLTTTEITSPTIVKLSSGNALPTATILGNGGRTIPTSVIDNDTTGNIETGTTTFDPAQDGIDFYESLEGMLVQVNNPVAVSPTNSFGETWVLADNGANATGRTARGGIVVSSNDFNPERIQIDDTLFTGSSPKVNVGATLGTITGVVDYNFSNYEVLPTSVTVISNTLTKEVTNLAPTTDQLTIATFNVENLDPSDGATKFNNLASRIVNNLKSPDIISLEEIQDNNGATNDSVVDASTTFQTLIDAIAAAGGPRYQYRQINPVDDTNGGEPGGNIRVGFLFNPDRVSFVDRPGGTSTSSTTVTDLGGVSASPGLIDPTNSAFNASRKPLVGEFNFKGETVYVIGNHFNSKGGDQPLFGPNQPPTLSSEVQRQQQATLVKNFVQNILAIDPNANIVVAGDLNDFEFSNPVSTLESAGLTSLIETLPQNERYTYNFEGNAQTLDHILVSSNLLGKLDAYDVVHVNSEFADQDSDHDPSVARFNLNDAPTAIALSATNINENVPNNTVVGTFTTTDPDTGNVFTYSLVPGTGDTDNAAFAIAGDSLKINSSPNFEAKSSYSIRVRSTDNGGLSVDKQLTIQVNDVNEAPTAIVDTVNIAEDATTSNLYTSLLSNDTDPDGGDTKNIISANTTGTKGQVSFNPTTQNLTYTASSFNSLSQGQIATDSFSYAIADSKGLESTAIVNVTVTGVNDAPTLVQPIDDQIISTNKPFSFNVSDKFADIDQADSLSYSATGLPTGSSIVANTGLISGTISQVGIFAVTVTANDGKGGKVSDSFDLTVANNKATTGNDIIFVSELTGLNQYIVNALAGSDRIIGTNTSELIDGGTGNDYIDGKGGIDILLGGDGNDTIFGGLGSDMISGGNGSDRLTGWGGGTNEIDLLNGDQGADTYILGDATSVFYANSGKGDYGDIVNFQTSDRIQLKGVATNYSLGSASAVSLDKSAVGIFTNNGAELIAVIENGLNRNTNLATDTRFVFI